MVLGTIQSRLESFVHGLALQDTYHLSLVNFRGHSGIHTMFVLSTATIYCGHGDCRSASLTHHLYCLRAVALEDVESMRAGIRLCASATGSDFGAGHGLVPSSRSRALCDIQTKMQQHMAGIDPDPHWDWNLTANSRTATCEVPILPVCCVQGSCSPAPMRRSSLMPTQSLRHTYHNQAPKLHTREHPAYFTCGLGHLTTPHRLSRSPNPVRTGVGPLNLPGPV